MERQKSKICNACNGKGKKTFGFDDSATCYQCNGMGTITEKRFQYLTEVYWPKKVEKGDMSQDVFDEKLAELTAWWNETGVEA